MTLHPDAEILITLAEELALPRIETLDAETARSHFDNRSAAAQGEAIASVVDRTFPGPGGDIGVRIYRPTTEPDPTPVVVFFHGGGWVIGTIDTHDAVCRSLANASDHTVVSVDYRLAPEHPYPAAVDDCYAATRWVAEHAEELAINPTRIAVAGDSAGGNLATIIAQMFVADGYPLMAQLLVYPATDLTDHQTDSSIAYADDHLLTADSIEWFSDCYAPDPRSRTEPRCSPAFGELKGLPPTLILLAECDPLRTDGERYAADLRAADVPTELVQFDGQVHSFFTQVTLIADARRAVDALARFLHSLT